MDSPSTADSQGGGQQRWSVWLARWNNRPVEFFGGKIPLSMFGTVIGVYRTAEEAANHPLSAGPLYDRPIAWLIQRATDEYAGGRPYVSACFGGSVSRVDDNDVVAVYETQGDAEAEVAAMEARAANELANKPDWRTLPDNCAYCGHPRIWHAGFCIWEDDVDESGHWTMCLKDCQRYVPPNGISADDSDDLRIITTEYDGETEREIDFP